MKNKITKFFTFIIFLSLAILFVAKFGGPSILRLYIESGIGTCEKIPLLCMNPTEEINNPAINKAYVRELLPYKFPNFIIRLPKGFTVIQEKITKVYYKRNVRLGKGATIYLLCKRPNFFMNLFPQLTKQGVGDDYEFIKRIMYAKTKDVKNLTDAFFVIMKGIFTPDVGEQRNAKMAKFSIAKKRGFINYNLGNPDNYFDCNIISSEGGFFKIYIKDRGARLDLEKVLAIISTVHEVR